MPILPSERRVWLVSFIVILLNRSIIVFGEFNAVAKVGTPSNAVFANA